MPQRIDEAPEPDVTEESATTGQVATVSEPKNLQTPEAVKDSEPDKAPEDRDEQFFLTRLLGERRLRLYESDRARLWAWLAPALVTVLATVIRLFRLGHPHKVVFDETYYVKQGYSLLRWGYEVAWPETANESWEAGHLDVWLTNPEYVAHPPMGKWMIALGLIPDPTSPVNWRLSTAICGIIAVLLVTLVATRIFASIPLGAAVGVLMAVDGQAIVHSRISLLDNFLMFWVLVAFVLLIIDREWARRRLAVRMVEMESSGTIHPWGPKLGIRWWRIAAAVAIGLSISVKWSGLYFLMIFGILTVIADAHARYVAGVEKWHVGALLRDAIPAGLIMVPLSAVIYVASWFGWYMNPRAFYRDWGANNPINYDWYVPSFLHDAADVMRSWWHFHTELWDFHNGLATEHPYMANAWGFPLQLRATSMHYASPTPGQEVCGADSCSEAITAFGNPILWWLATLAMFYAVYCLIRFLDWRAVAVLGGIVAGWVPWLFYPERTIYTFYSIAFLPWMCLSLGYAGLRLVEWADDDPRRRRTAWGVIIGVLALIVAATIYFLPVWTGIPIPYDQWLQRMWFRPEVAGPLLGWI